MTTTIKNENPVETAKPSSLGNEGDPERLKDELDSLFDHLNRLRSELSAIRRPGDNDLDFLRTGNQLEEVVAATEKATETIMGVMEKNEEIVARLQDGETDPDRQVLLSRIVENGYEAMEACAFQDITGQRVGKVLKFVEHIEIHINALIDIWGREDIENGDGETLDHRSEDEKLLGGPALQNEGISQDEIDNLFD